MQTFLMVSVPGVGARLNERFPLQWIVEQCGPDLCLSQGLSLCQVCGVLALEVSSAWQPRLRGEQEGRLSPVSCSGLNLSRGMNSMCRWT